MSARARRRIAVMTGSRAEYGLLEPLIRLIRADRGAELRLIVTGPHLEPSQGMTIREIAADGHPIAARIPMRLGSGGARVLAEAMSRAVAGLARAYARLKPDILVILGDRLEVLAAAAAALPFRIPVAHIHGGEATFGAWDEQVRHAVTKLSHLHFTAHADYAGRLVRMGEDPRRVFAFGSPGADRLLSAPRLSRETLSRELGHHLKRPIGIVAYHPVTLAADYGLRDLEVLLGALARRDGTWIFTHPNPDSGGRRILARVSAFVKAHPDRACARASLGRTLFPALLAHADLMVGNSSSGLLEAPCFRLPAVNLGPRQEGRLRRGNVIDVPRADRLSLDRALDRALDRRFRRALQPPAEARSSPSRRILSVLKKIRLGRALLVKRFHE